ncbi:uncharacterized protein LOC134722439 [Mytilus trossulus]|uniref:uncharacterized protein LOC134722439 n=1 Tax=Mytilus trossulus TaxID=6551 RepID=UPI00300426FE
MMKQQFFLLQGLSYFQMTFGFIGQCVFPCSLQGKSFSPIIGGIFQAGSVIGEYGSEDPSILTFTITNQNIQKQEIWECYARSGPFFAYRRKLNETYVQYRCEKRPLVAINSDGDIRVVFGSEWVYFAEPPTLCDVCNGKLTVSPVIQEVSTTCGEVKLLDVGCNIPNVCRIQDPQRQTRCECEPYETDDGLCCDM